MYLKGEYRVFYFNWKLLWANYKCQGKTYQAVNKCYTISVSFLPSGKTQFPQTVLCSLQRCYSWQYGKWTFIREIPTAGSAARGREGAVEVVVLMSWAVPLWWRSHKLFSRGLCLSAQTKKRPYASRWWGCELPSPLLPDQVPAAGTGCLHAGFRKFHICKLFEYLE